MKMNTKCCLTVCSSIEIRHDVHVGASLEGVCLLFCSISVTYDGAVLV